MSKASFFTRLRELPILPAGFTLFCALYYLTDQARPHRNVFYLGVLIPFFFLMKKRYYKALFSSPAFWLTSALVSWLCASLAWGRSIPAEEVANTLRIGILTILFFCASFMAFYSRPQFNKEFALWVGLAASVGTVLSMQSFYSIYPFPGTRLESIGTSGHPIRSATFYGVIFLCVWFNLFIDAKNNRERLMGIVLLAFIGTFILFTQSRGPMLGIGVILFLGAILKRQWWLALALLAVPLAYLAITSHDPHSFVARGDSYRFEIWEAGIKRVMQHPWLGYGLLPEQRFRMHDGMFIVHPHNIFIANQLYGGVIASVLLCILLLLCTYNAWLYFRRSGNFLLLGLVFFIAVSGTFDYSTLIRSTNIEWMFFWMPLGMIAAYQKKYEG